jgi:tetratricopeptide (TPR) repeat protein
LASQTPEPRELIQAKQLVRQKDFSAAERLLRDAPESPASLYLLAYTLFRQGRPVESLDIYAEARRLEPPASDDWKVIGLNYGLLERWSESESALRSALAADPANLEARYYLGRVLYTQNRFEAAAAVFRDVLSADPQHAKARNHLGQALEALGETVRAAEAYRQAIAAAEQTGHASEYPYLNLAILHLQSGDPAEAVPLLERAAAINPNSAQVRFRLGTALAKLGRDEAAATQLAHAVRLEPKNAATRYVLARTYQKLGRKELAQEQLQASQQLRAGATRQ